MKFLIVDDNPDMRKMIIRKVCNDNDIVAECSDGSEALSRYSELLPDFVLMDIQMPKTDGLKATRIIREKFRTASIIIITDYDKPSFSRAAFKAGALAFFSKEHLAEVKKFINNNSIYRTTPK